MADRLTCECGGANAGDKVPARIKLGNRDYRQIEPAPGRYVKAKAE